MTHPAQNTIRVAILEDHQAIVDGYIFRLSSAAASAAPAVPGAVIQVVATLAYGEELEPALEQHPADVLILDVSVPTSPANPNPYPLLHLVPRLVEKYPSMQILVISMHSQRTLVRAVLESGASGYILKDDRAAMIELASIVRAVHAGGIFISAQISRSLRSANNDSAGPLTPRQAEVLSYCAAYPDLSTAQVAEQLRTAHSTIRNLLSGAYLRLEVSNRAAAILKARQMGLIPPDI